MGANAHNVPEFRNQPAGSVMVVPDVTGWEHRTEENWAPLPQVSVDAGAAGYGSAFETRLKQRGIYKKLKIRVSGEFTTAVGTGAVTVRDIWPHGVLRSIQIKGNGAAIHDLNGWLAHAYIQRRNRNPDVSGTITDPFAADSTPADDTYEYALDYEIPLCYDYATAVGSVYAESDGSEFILSGQVATKDELFALTGTADVTFGGMTIQPTLVFWDAPRDLVNGVDTLFVPDLSRLFQLQMRQPEVNSVGEFEGRVISSSGNLTSLIMALRNNKANVNIGAGGLDYLQWNYGVNLTPRNYNPTEHLLHENARMYDGQLPYDTFALDFDTENPRRDSTRPRGVTELVVKAGVPAATSLSSARFYMLHELLVAAQNSVAAAA